MLTGRKKRNLEAIGEGIKNPSQTHESPNVGEENLEELIMVKRVEQSGKNLTDQINRRMTRVKGKHWDQLRNYPEVSAAVRQIEEKWPLLSNLRKIKENMKENLAEFKAGRLMEVDAKQKLLQVKKKLNYIDQQLQLYTWYILGKKKIAHFHGLQEALDKTRCGETPDYLKRIATQIEVYRGKATKFGHKNIEILVCAAIKDMEDWRTPKDSDYNQLKKWAATLNMGKEQDFEVKFADDMLNNICLAWFAYSMIFGEDGSAHKVASGRV